MKTLKQIAFLWLLCSLVLAASAQDTALLRLQKLPDDTTKVNQLLAYGKPLTKSDAGQAKLVFNQAIGIAQKIHDATGEGRALMNLGYINLSAGHYDSCIQQFHEAIRLFRQTKNIKEICSAQLDLAAAFSTSGQRDSSFYYLMTALKVLETQPFIRERARAYLNLGTQYNNLKSYDKAISYQQKALALVKPARDTPMLLNTYSALSLSYDNQEKKQQAFSMINAAMPYLTAGSSKFSACRIYNQYAYACVGIGNYNEAIGAAQKAISLANEVHDVNHLGSATLTLATAHHKKGDHQKAINLVNGLAASSEAAYNSVLDEVFELLAEAYTATGDYHKATNAYRRLLAVKDSLFSSETNEMIAEQEVSYQTAQREKALSQSRLQLAQKDLQLQKNRYVMYFTLAALVVSMLLVALLVIQRRHRKRLHQKEVKSIQQDKEIQLLQALMQGEEKERGRIAKDLHDGVAGMLAAVKMHFSSMPVADEVLQVEGYQQGMKLLNDATQEIRKTSHNLMPEVLLQHGLDEALRRYCNNVNNSRRLQIQYDSWGEIGRFVDSFELSVYRIVQELLNNILKHSRATQALVQLNQQEGVLSITIEDNGVGFSTDAGTEGMGLRSLQRRIKAMNGKMELEASEQSGVCAYLEFDIADLKKELAVSYE